MITNGSLTIFHKGFDTTTRLEKWIRFNYSNVWFFSKEKASLNEGINNANIFDCRIPYDKNANLDAKNFAKGDIVVNETINYDINSDDDLTDFVTYNITSITNANFGERPHIHIGGE